MQQPSDKELAEIRHQATRTLRTVTRVAFAVAAIIPALALAGFVKHAWGRELSAQEIGQAIAALACVTAFFCGILAPLIAYIFWSKIRMNKLFNAARRFEGTINEVRAIHMSRGGKIWIVVAEFEDASGLKHQVGLQSFAEYNPEETKHCVIYAAPGNSNLVAGLMPRVGSQTAQVVMGKLKPVSRI